MRALIAVGVGALFLASCETCPPGPLCGNRLVVSVGDASGSLTDFVLTATWDADGGTEQTITCPGATGCASGSATLVPAGAGSVTLTATSARRVGSATVTPIYGAMAGQSVCDLCRYATASVTVQ